MQSLVYVYANTIYGVWHVPYFRVRGVIIIDILLRSEKSIALALKSNLFVIDDGTLKILDIIDPLTAGYVRTIYVIYIAFTFRIRKLQDELLFF